MPQLPLVPGCHGPRVLTGYTLNGYELVFLENELLRVAINVGRGSHIPEFTYKPKDLDILFKPPRAHKHHTSFIPTAFDEKPYFDHHAGGWFECFPGGGPGGEFHGGKLGFHGEVWGQPFEIEDQQEHAGGCSLTLTGFTHRTPFQLTKTFSLNAHEAALTIAERITNLGAVDLKVLWGQHPTLGAPFLNPECYLECGARHYLDGNDEPPVRRPWPSRAGGEDLARTRPQESHTSKMFYFTGFDRGTARVVSPPWKLAFEIDWDAARFPFLWFCETAGSLGMPWYGRAYFLALEPFTGISREFEAGAGLLSIPAGATVEAQFTGRIVPL